MTDLTVIGYPKSGNTWLSRLLGDALDSPVMSGKNKPALADEGFNRKGEYVIRQLHLLKQSERPSGKSVFIVRDPRDVAVSVMHYWKRKSLMMVIRGMAGISNSKHAAPLNKSGGWINYVNRWLDSNNFDTLVKYEDLHRDTYSTVMETLSALGEHPTADIRVVIKRQSFESRKKSIHKDMPYGDSIQHNLMRKGIVGDWKNHFNRADARFMHEHFFTTMLRLEYENDDNWWKKVKE